MIRELADQKGVQFNNMIKLIPVTDYFTVNCYFVIDDKTNTGILIDPGAQADLILNIISQKNWRIEKILLTHGHFDHTGAVKSIQDKLNISAYAHQRADDYLLNPSLNLSRACVGDRLCVNTKKLNISNITLENSELYCEVFQTPGHSFDSVSYYFPKENAIFVGDLFYNHSLGLTHFPGGDFDSLKRSIEDSILTLPESTMIYSGHSSPITVGEQAQLLKRDNLI